MELTKEKIDAIHPVYRDFMMALKPIIDSRQQPFPIQGLSASDIFDASARKYGFDPHQFYEIADNLRRNGLIERDRFGFYCPTGAGEEFIMQLYRLLVPGDPIPGGTPPFQLGD